MKLDGFDFTATSPYKGALKAAGCCVNRGFRPWRLRVSQSDYVNIQFGTSYLHEYIDEENRSYLVLRLPERLLVYVDPKCAVGVSFMECRSPDVEIEINLAY